MGYIAPNTVSAQLLPGTVGSKSDTPDTGGLGALIDQARKDGSTVIIVRPDDGDSDAAADAESLAQTEQFYRARSQIRKIIASAPALLPNIQKTLVLASPDGSAFWIAQAIGTALLGLFLCCGGRTNRSCLASMGTTTRGTNAPIQQQRL